MKVQKLIKKIQEYPLANKKFSWDHNQLRYKRRFWLGDNSGLKKAVLQEAHKGPNGGYSGVKKTLERVKRAFYWIKLSKEVCTFVAECEVCQRNKTENISTSGLIQPLPIPDQVWTDIFMDFIEGLPSLKERMLFLWSSIGLVNMLSL